MKTTFITVLISLLSFYGFSQQLVYKPINPAFGGDTFNYQWLLSSANAQNPFDDDKDKYGSNLDDYDSLDSFTKSLNRQILNQITNSMFDGAIGDKGLAPGNYVFGSLYLEVTQASQGLVINILDTSTGEQSQIIIPR